MKKNLFNYTKNLYQKNKQQADTRLKCSPSLLSLKHDYGFGRLETLGEYIHFTRGDLEQLRTQCKEQGYDLTAAYPAAKSRIDNAKNGQRNEKLNALPVAQDFVLLNSLSLLKLNGQNIEPSPINSLGLYINSKQVHSLEHKIIILVENLSVMACLPLLNVSNELHDALWVYRGDADLKQTTSTAYNFFRKWQKTHTLVCFSDFDPKGLEIACTSGAEYYLSPKQSLWSQILNAPLIGPENEWHHQQYAKNWLNKQKPYLSSQINSAFNAMNEHQSTYKQEHIICNNIDLELIPINSQKPCLITS